MKAFLATVLGFVGHAAVTAAEPPDPPSAEEIAHHWKQVKDYRALVDNPENYERDPTTGLGVVSVPNIQPSLAFLVAAGEMEHVTLVLPDVPQNRSTTRHWLNWAADGKRHGVIDGLWEMTGNSVDTEKFGITGEQPLQLKVWYDPAITDDLRQLVQELQTLELLDDIERLRNPPPRRQVADLVIPPHPHREALIGEWASEGETVYTIEELDGQVLIRPIQGPTAEAVINNLRWEDDTLRFDEYWYFVDPDNPAFAHPFVGGGVRSDSTFMIHADPDRLIQRAVIELTGETIEGELTRVVE